MKKFLTIIFGIFVVLSFAGCKSTPVVEEELIEEEIIFKHPESYHFEVFTYTGKYPNIQYKSLGIIEVPKDVPVKVETSEKRDGFKLELQENKYELGTPANSVELEYLIYEDVEVLRFTEIYEPNYFSAERIGKEFYRDIMPTIRENDRMTTYHFLTDGHGPRHELAKKFYEEVVLNQ